MGHDVLFTESLTIAEVMVENQIVGVVMSLLDPFTNLLGDGILALSPFDIKSPSFEDNAFDGGKLSGIIFAVYLPHRGEGEIMIGGVNTTRYTGNLIHVSLSYPLAWQITIEDIRCRGRPLGITLEATIEMTASSILLDKRAAYALYWKVPGAKRYTASRWTFPCNSNLNFFDHDEWGQVQGPKGQYQSGTGGCGESRLCLGNSVRGRGGACDSGTAVKAGCEVRNSQPNSSFFVETFSIH